MKISDVISYYVEKLVSILKAELELELGKLKDKLHARTLERIFIEERIYSSIEQEKTQEGVQNAVLNGFVPFRKEIRREVTKEDVESLLKIPIRRISLYDINKARKEIQEIQTRIAEIRSHLENIREYAVRFLDGLKERYGSASERKTEITSFSKTDVREAARRNLPLRYDEESGYLGHGLSSGTSLFDVSPYDRILVIRKSGAWSVFDVPEKLFVDSGMQFCCLAEKERLSRMIFSVVYRNDKKQTYLKRCRLDQYILDRGYSLVPAGARLELLTIREDVEIAVKYTPKPQMKILEEKFAVKDYLVKSKDAQGVRLTAKAVSSLRLVVRKPASQSGAQAKNKAAVQNRAKTQRTPRTPKKKPDTES
jgi:topoisomerase IV subunit A